jgi:hypothetical protein
MSCLPWTRRSTLDTDSHVLPTIQKRAAEKIDALFRGMAKNVVQ